MVPTDFTFNNLVAMNIYQIDLFFQKELLILVYYNVVDWSPISIVCKQLFLPKWLKFLDLQTSRPTMKSPVKVGMKCHLSFSLFCLFLSSSSLWGSDGSGTWKLPGFRVLEVGPWRNEFLHLSIKVSCIFDDFRGLNFGKCCKKLRKVVFKLP